MQIETKMPLAAPLLLASETGNIVRRTHPGSFGDTTEERVEVVQHLLEGIELIPAMPPLEHKRARSPRRSG